MNIGSDNKADRRADQESPQVQGGPPVPDEAVPGDEGTGPLVDRPRRPRRRLVPTPVIAGVLAAVLAVGLIIAAAVWYSTSLRVTVPDLVGRTDGVARVELAREGLEISSVERRFDESPAGTVLAQDPGAGSVVLRGSGVAIVVSGGTEELRMPDVIGLQINVARAQLEQSGLVVRIEAVPSEEASDTVLETIPAPGATVRTSDIVRVRIAATGTATSALLPFELRESLFVLDPAPGIDGEVDAPLEVVRRLRSLLEASGARVVVTRSITDVDVTTAMRAERAGVTTATVSALVTIEATPQPPGGLAVIHIDTLPANSPGVLLADEVARMLGEDDRPVLRSTVEADPLLEAVSGPAVRIRIGSYAVPEDIAAFRDPTWSDTVARAIYRALGDHFTGE